MSTTSTPNDLIAHVQELLNEEKWTRATLNNYTVTSLEELDGTIAAVQTNALEQEVLDVCDEHLHHTKNSIIALFISGVLNLSRQSVDDANLIHLTKIFTDNHKWNIVEFLANRILDFGENRFALRILADVYDSENQTDKLHDVWERLIRVDFEEADIVRQLAVLREQDGKVPEAVTYYKKALHRYISKKSFSNVKEVWQKLVELAPEETEFFYHAESKIARSISAERAVQLLEDYYPHFQENQEWDQAIEVLKRVLNYDSKNEWARKEITDCFRQKFTEHSNLEEYIRISNLNQDWRPVHDAIADFEKHISFDTGNFVHHRTWGVGRIRSIKGDEITIDFAKKRGHAMSLKMAVNALDVLAKDHIWVLRAVWKTDKLRTLVKKNIVWTLKTVIRSLGNAADMKKIKAELVPAILKQSEWSSWSTKARTILKTNPDFGTLTDRLDHFVVRDQPITFEEKTFNKFKAQTNFFDRVKTLEEFLSYVEEEGGDGIDSEFFREMFEYFAGFVRNPSSVTEQTVSSLLVVNEVVSRYPFLRQDLELDFQRLYDYIENVEELFVRIDSSDLRRRFLSGVRAVDRNWGETYVRLLPYHLSRDALVELEKYGRRDLLLKFVSQSHENYRDFREPFVWVVRNCSDDPWFDEIGLTLEKRLIAMIHICDLTFREIDNRKDVSANRKINKQVQTWLFRDGNLSEYLAVADRDSVARLFTLVNDVKDLDPKTLLELKNLVVERFPDYHFHGTEETAVVATRGFFTCESSYEAKQKEYSHLQRVEVPENTKEIEKAVAYGDLSENAEYKAAKERQDSLNNRAARLKLELSQARIVKPGEVETERVQFGTVVELDDLERKGTTVCYTILGPWESNPDADIISYQTPLGNKIYNSSVGDELDFEINEKRHHFIVKKIEAADLTGVRG
jgi:transcription elongation factor GreA